MRRTLKRQVTKTTIKLARMEFKDGEAVSTLLPDEFMVGNVTLEQANRQMRKKHGDNVVVMALQANTDMYQMPLEDFIKYAEKVEDVEKEEVAEATTGQA